jgi:hypothetical protein
MAPRRRRKLWSSLQRRRAASRFKMGGLTDCNVAFGRARYCFLFR